MQNDLKEVTGLRSLISRRRFIGAAAATGIAGVFPASLRSLTAQATAKKAAQLVLPTTTKDVVPFKIRVPQEALDDLKRRLASTRWPERETVGDWSQGVPLQKAQALVAYWRDKHGWRRFEARMNAFPQYRTQIDGVWHSFHPRALPSAERPADHSHARMAGIGRGVHGGHRPAQRSHPLRGKSGGRVPCRRAVAPRFWLLRQAGRNGLGCEQDRPRLGDADATSWLRALGRTGGRLGGGRHARLGASAAPGLDRGPCELAVRLCRKASRQTPASRAATHRRSIAVRQRLERLFSRTGDASADHWLSAC